jgi:hypothetical protein
LLSQIYEVLLDIVTPWQREWNEKRELLAEDPFVGYATVATLGAVFYYFARQSPSWIGFFLLYAGVVMFIVGGCAALSAGWFGWAFYRRAAWPTAFLALVVYGCFDSYLVTTVSEEQSAGIFRGEEGAKRVTTQTDEIKRFTGRPLWRNLESIDQVAGRPVRRIIEEGPLDSAGRKHGRFETFSVIPKRTEPTTKWYWQDKEMSRADWEKAKQG